MRKELAENIIRCLARTHRCALAIGNEKSIDNHDCFFALPNMRNKNPCFINIDDNEGNRECFDVIQLPSLHQDIIDCPSDNAIACALARPLANGFQLLNIGTYKHSSDL